MDRKLSIFASLFLFAALAHGQIVQGIVTIQAASSSLPTGSVTQANLRLSTINGTAFVDFNASGSLCPYVGDKLTITDSTAHTVVGWIKACGSGETYGTEQEGAPGMDNSGWFGQQNSTFTLLTSGCQAGNCAQLNLTSANGSMTQNSNNSTIGSGMLFLDSTYMKQGTETGNLCFKVGDGVNNSSTSMVSVCAAPTSWTQYSFYHTEVSAAGQTMQYFGTTNAKTSLFDTSSCKQVLTPSSIGVTIVSTSGGSTFNWSSVNGSFTFNSAAGYTYAITAT